MVYANRLADPRQTAPIHWENTRVSARATTKAIRIRSRGARVRRIQ